MQRLLIAIAITAIFGAGLYMGLVKKSNDQLKY